MKAPEVAKTPAVEPKPAEAKATPEDATARVKRLTELLRARFTQELSTDGGSAVIQAWLRAD